MIVDGLKNKKDGVLFGTRNDVCYFCATEAAIDNYNERKSYGLTRETAGEALKGQLMGKPIFRFPISGGPYIICRKHINEIVKNMDQLLDGKNEKDNI